MTHQKIGQNIINFANRVGLNIPGDKEIEIMKSDCNKIEILTVYLKTTGNRPNESVYHFRLLQ